jgi:hypothetical protein
VGKHINQHGLRKLLNVHTCEDHHGSDHVDILVDSANVVDGSDHVEIHDCWVHVSCDQLVVGSIVYVDAAVLVALGAGAGYELREISLESLNGQGDADSLLRR